MIDLETRGWVHSIESFGTLDGPGIRYVLFLQGCALRCLYCHNPDTWDMSSGTCTTVKETLANILSYRTFIRKGGVTLSGGEPLLQPDFVCGILEGCHAQGLHTAIDTSGAIPLARAKPVLDRADLILLDIKALDDALCTRLTGQSNRETLATLDYCEAMKIPVWIRHVVVPGYTYDKHLLAQLADYLTRFSVIRKIELLPFHKMGEYKWKKLNCAYSLEQVPALSDGEIETARALFRARGLPL